MVHYSDNYEQDKEQWRQKQMEKRTMPDGLTAAAKTLFAAAVKYEKLFKQLHGETPVIYVDHIDTGKTVFICNDENAKIIKKGVTVSKI